MLCNCCGERQATELIDKFYLTETYCLLCADSWHNLMDLGYVCRCQRMTAKKQEMVIRRDDGMFYSDDNCWYPEYPEARIFTHWNIAGGVLTKLKTKGFKVRLILDYGLDTQAGIA